MRLPQTQPAAGPRSRIAGILAAGLCLSLLLLALHWTDVSCRVGELGSSGGAVVPFELEAGKGLYGLILSARTAPSFHGAARVRLEGEPAMDYALYDLSRLFHPGQRNRPPLQDGILSGLHPGDRFKLGVMMQPKLVAVPGSEVPIASCCVPPRSLDSSSQGEEQPIPLRLSFYDTNSNRPLLVIPVHFSRPE